MQWENSFNEVCDSLFRLTLTCSSGTYFGSGFTVAKFKKPDKLAFAIATAGHLLKKAPKNENSLWLVERFDIKGNGIEWYKFKTNPEKLDKSPMRIHTEFDIGLLFMPQNKDKTYIKPLRLIDISLGVQPGSRVGWAGFPTFAQNKTATPHPCYFEGVVSAIVDKKDRLYYLVDGRGGKGLSGGPLWYWNDELNNYEIAGICCQYLNSEELGVPGLVVFEAINPAEAYLMKSEELEINIKGKS